MGRKNIRETYDITLCQMKAPKLNPQTTQNISLDSKKQVNEVLERWLPLESKAGHMLEKDQGQSLTDFICKLGHGFVTQSWTALG